MVTVTKKHQTSLALFAVAFATLMIAGVFASTDNSVFARKNAQVSQSIAETCDQDQKAPVTTAGAISPPILSGINAGICVNLNAGGNAADQDQSTQSNHDDQGN
jgi:hypothetical protein